MSVVKNVLVATDLSAPSEVAVRAAHEIALRESAGLTVLHVVHMREPVAMLFPQDRAVDGSATSALTDRALEALRAHVVAATGRSVESFTARAITGEAAPEILRFAEESGADLVVVGPHGRSGIARMLLGSVSDRVVRYAHSPVYVARASPPGGIVLATTDLSDPSLPALEAGARESRRRGAPLVVMSVVAEPEAILPPPGAPPTLTAGLPGPSLGALDDETRAAVAAVEARLRTEIDKRGITAEIVVRTGTVRATIVDEAERRGASLVVVGTRGRTGIKRIALGSVAEGVVHAAHCAVLVVRLHD